MQKDALLIEIGTEELPPVRLDKLANAWLEAFLGELDKAKVPHGGGRFFIAPRRMALLINDCARMTESRTVQKRGPALSAAFKDGKPSPAAEGFARSVGTTVDKLSEVSTDKGTWLSFDMTEAGQKSEDFVNEALQKSITQLPIGKKMRWASHDFDFIRPVHWLVVLHGDTVLPIELFGKKAHRNSYGHRFHHPEAVALKTADDYVESLREAFVIADYQERKEHIRSQAEHVAKTKAATVVMDEPLLDLVTGLNEWPVPMLADFSPEFLKVPQEALITSMQHHQKCFALVDDQQKLLPTFVLTANTDAKPADLIVHGNERVMHARLNDAQFFYHQDCKTKLDTHLNGLKNMVFHKKLGTLFDKCQRVKKLSVWIATQLKLPIHHAERCAQLYKCDLLTEMVGEFPELQGIMGYYYALHAGEPEVVAVAIKDSYKPRFAKDTLPESDLGTVLSLAERVDTLVGIFGVGHAPTGDKDPYGLRRACLGLLRILVEKGLDLNLSEMLEHAVAGYRTQVSDEIIPELLQFSFERFKAWYQEQGVPSKTIEAVVAAQSLSHPLDFSKRIEAVSQFQNLPESEALAAANKRVRNILTKSGVHIDFNLSPAIDVDLLDDPSEQELYQLLTDIKERTAPFMAQGQYAKTLSELAQLKSSVDAFFDKVMVNVEDDNLRQNRINLLSNLHNAFGQIADISRLS